MIKKDYELIAAVLYETRPRKRRYPTTYTEDCRQFVWQKIVDSLSAKLKLQSCRFDEARFKGACGVARFKEDDE
jgi:hypothetical protein